MHKTNLCQTLKRYAQHKFLPSINSENFNFKKENLLCEGSRNKYDIPKCNGKDNEQPKMGPTSIIPYSLAPYA